MPGASPPRAPVAVTLLAGFLGSGKTTLLNRLLSESHGERIAVLVNDFGDVSIDERLVVSRDESTIALANGCVCCTVRDDLIDTTKQLLRRAEPPERIVIELSGIAEPGSVLRTVALMGKTWPLELDGVIAVVDAEGFPAPGEEHYLLAREQLALADLVVINKADLVTPAALDALETRIRSAVPPARIARAVEGHVPLEVALGIGRHVRPEADSALAEPALHRHGDFATLTLREPRRLSLERVREVFDELPASVYRAKGLLWVDEKPDYELVLQIVGRRARVSLGRAWGARTPESVVVLVGASGALRAEALGDLLARSVPPSGARVLRPLRGMLEWLRAAKRPP